MPRRARVIIPHVAHHVVQRGNNKRNVFESEDDFKKYCYWINKYAQEHRVDILAYCLMNNHAHHIMVPENDWGMAKLLKMTHMRYSQYSNHKNGTIGHLWQGRYYSCVMDDAHLYRAMRYVEQNPVRAGMVRYSWEYPWSSAPYHVGKQVDHYIRVKDSEMIDRADWKEYLQEADVGVNEKIRKATHGGKAVADEIFIQYWERQKACVLRKLTPGRKKINEGQTPISSISKK